MPKVYQIGKVAIRVYADDHLPPHFHIVGTDDEALVEIATLTVLRGRIPDAAAMAWARENIATIRTAWNAYNPRFPIA